MVVIFQTAIMDRYLGCFLLITLRLILQAFPYLVNLGLGNGLVPSDNKPLPGPILTNQFGTIWRH